MSMLNTVTDAVARLDDIESVIDPSTISPGVASFFAILLLAVAAFLLLISMVRRLRRVRYREEVREKISEEIAERDGDVPRGPDDTASDSDK